MAKGISVKLIGIPQFKSAYAAFVLDAHQEVKNAVAAAAIEVQANAKRFCPVDTGRLRSSIALKFYTGGMVAEVGTNVEYAPHVEYGTRFQRAQPFLGPAYEKTMGWFREALAEAINKAIGRAK